MVGQQYIKDFIFDVIFAFFLFISSQFIQSITNCFFFIQSLPWFRLPREENRKFLLITYGVWRMIQSQTVGELAHAHVRSVFFLIVEKYKTFQFSWNRFYRLYFWLLFPCWLPPQTVVPLKFPLFMRTKPSAPSFDVNKVHATTQHNTTSTVRYIECLSRVFVLQCVGTWYGKRREKKKKKKTQRRRGETLERWRPMFMTALHITHTNVNNHIRITIYGTRYTVHHKHTGCTVYGYETERRTEQKLVHKIGCMHPYESLIQTVSS